MTSRTSQTSCIRCNTPYTPGGHFCHYCGFPHDRPDAGPSLSLLAGEDRVIALRPGPAPRRKPSLPLAGISARLAVLALLFPRSLDE